MPSPHKYDFPVIGSGSAGLTIALKVADHGSVTVITKDKKNEAYTPTMFKEVLPAL